MKKLKEMYDNLNVRIMRIMSNEKGQTMIEYALVAVLIAIVLVFVFRSAGVNRGISAAASRINSALANAQ